MTIRSSWVVGLLALGIGLCGLSACAADMAAQPAKPPVTKNLKVWLAADAGVTKDATGNVSAWASQVDPKLTFTQDDATAQPLWMKDALNGKPALRFNGESDILKSAALPADFAGDFTVFIVWASPTTQKNLQQDGVNNRLISAPTATAADYEKGFQFTTGTKEKVAPSVVTGNFPNRPALTYLGLGAFTTSDGAVSGFWLTGDLAEVLIYNATLPEADMAAVSKYLQEKYKVTPAPKP
ncbi:MAG TPA: hypothetical protein VGL77_16675 [Armatimonadota bacterium]|jgi:hypothetical protein